MITIQLMGGLGNQLFQIFATIAYAIEHSHQFVFPYSHTLGVGHIRPTYWHNFMTNLTIFTTKNPLCKFSNDALKTIPTLKENGFHYIPIPAISSNHSISLHGYYQSYKYFEKYQAKIYSFLLLTNQQKMIQAKYAELLDSKSVISMHFRLGDYKEKQQFHPIMPKEYYKNALAYILKTSHTMDDRIRVLYFCEAEDIIFVSGVITYLREVYNHYPNIEFIHVSDEVADWEQMLLMSCCNHHILANSSFSWWGAYLNQSEKKCVCYPSLWFGEAMVEINLNDLFPPDWVKINVY